ncbi:hypothetical protein ACJX0J_037168, partial [Zea mays]
NCAPGESSVELHFPWNSSSFWALEDRVYPAYFPFSNFAFIDPYRNMQMTANEFLAALSGLTFYWSLLKLKVLSPSTALLPFRAHELEVVGHNIKALEDDHVVMKAIKPFSYGNPTGESIMEFT